MSFLMRLAAGTSLSWQGPAATRPAVPCRSPRRSNDGLSPVVPAGRVAGAPEVIRGEGPRAHHP